MARYTGPSCRLCRREGEKLFLKGERCYTDKCAVDKRGTVPGQHRDRRSKLSDYGRQLRESQKIKRIYGLLERQFRNFFGRALRAKGKTGEALIQSLELRLDSFVHRMGLAPSRAAARQLVRHNHILLNGKRCNIPSALVSLGDEVTLVEASRSMPAVLAALEVSKRSGHEVPSWIKFDAERFAGKLLSLPPRDEIQIPVKEQLVVELYSK